MNIIARFTKLIHWIVFVLFSSLILVVLPSIISGQDNIVYIGRIITLEGDAEKAGIILYSALIIPFIRYIVFGKIGWFPWTPIRKE